MGTSSGRPRDVILASGFFRDVILASGFFPDLSQLNPGLNNSRSFYACSYCSNYSKYSI